MGRSSLEWLCFFIAVVRRGSSLAAHLHISHAKDILAPVYDRFTDGFCDCGHADRASPARLAPAASSVTLICWRRAMRAKFALDITFRLQTRDDSPVAADRRSRAVERATADIRRDSGNPTALRAPSDPAAIRRKSPAGPPGSRPRASQNSIEFAPPAASARVRCGGCVRNPRYRAP